MDKDEAATQHHLVMKNKPGELLKLTRFLSDSGLRVSALRVASLGETASIRFSTPGPCVLPRSIRAARIG